MKQRSNIRTVLVLLALVLLLVIFPLVTLRDAEFGGSDDAGSVKIEELHEGYEPWFTPVAERFLGGEIPGEIESLIFCVQTGLGVGVLAFFLGRMAERKKWTKDDSSEE